MRKYYESLTVFLIILGLIGVAGQRIRADDAKPNVAAAEPAQPQAPAAEKRVTKIYDIRPLIIFDGDLPFSTSPHSNAFMNPADRASEDSPGPIGAYIRPPPPPTRDQLAGDVAALISATIAPDSWKEGAGTIGEIRVFHSSLIITQTMANHQAIAAFLHDLAADRGKTVRTSVDWILLSPGDLEKITKAVEPGRKPPPWREINSDVIDRLPATSRHFHAELLSLNGQVVHYLSGRERIVAVNETGTVGERAAAYTPYIRGIGGGIALQFSSVVDREQNKAIINLFTTYNDAKKPGPPEAIHSYFATTQPAPGAGEGIGEASAVYHPLDAIVQEFRTTARIPVGAPILLGAMTLEPAGKNAAAPELAVIVNVRELEP